MKITSLIENILGGSKELDIEHGLSLYIEADDKKVLFDTGKSGNFIDNANQLKINLKNLDYVVISHGHNDHSGGLERLIEEINPDIKIYLGGGFFNEKYSLREDGNYQYTGSPFDQDFLKNNNIYWEYAKDDIINISDNLLLFTNFNRREEFENTNESMYLKEGHKYVKDMFLDEVSLGIKTDKGLVIVVGCSHVGIVNIIDTIITRTNMNIYAILGGTHLVKEDDEKINKVIEYFIDNDIKTLAACHCTGKHGETMFSQQLEDIYINYNTGDVFKI